MIKKVDLKTIAVGTGIAAIWIGGFAVCWIIGDAVGKGVGKVCTKATERLLTL